MNFSFPKHNTTGALNGDDLVFFYYDIGLDNLQEWPVAYEWESAVDEFKNVLDIDSCTTEEMPSDFATNNIRFTVSDDKNLDNGSKSVAFFRHLRNAFAHYNVVREGDNFILTDGKKTTTMRGLVSAELLKQFCFKFFDIREKFMSDHDNSNNSTL